MHCDEVIKESLEVKVKTLPYNYIIYPYVIIFNDKKYGFYFLGKCYSKPLLNNDTQENICGYKMKIITYYFEQESLDKADNEIIKELILKVLNKLPNNKDLGTIKIKTSLINDKFINNDFQEYQKLIFVNNDEDFYDGYMNQNANKIMTDILENNINNEEEQ